MNWRKGIKVFSILAVLSFVANLAITFMIVQNAREQRDYQQTLQESTAFANEQKQLKEERDKQRAMEAKSLQFRIVDVKLIEVTQEPGATSNDQIALLDIEFSNTGPVALWVGPLSIRVRDETGAEKKRTISPATIETSLKSGPLPPNEHVRGTVAFIISSSGAPLYVQVLNKKEKITF